MSTTDLKRTVLGRAVKRLRARLGWSQKRLATALEAIERRPSGSIKQPVISRWEQGLSAPLRHTRAALAQIARECRAADLAGLFEANTRRWNLMMDCWTAAVGAKQEHEQGAGPNQVAA
jgi:transcriptional regulator with XRE-family HTH domain